MLYAWYFSFRFVFASQTRRIMIIFFLWFLLVLFVQKAHRESQHKFIKNIYIKILYYRTVILYVMCVHHPCFACALNIYIYRLYDNILYVYMIYAWYEFSRVHKSLAMDAPCPRSSRYVPSTTHTSHAPLLEPARPLRLYSFAL